MASGGQTHQGVVAVIDYSIPFGTRVYIDGIGTFTVEDHIGAHSDFDIWMPDCGAAYRFGRKHRKVTIL